MTSLSRILGGWIPSAAPAVGQSIQVQSLNPLVTSWVTPLTSANGVLSVNGKQGAVTLVHGDISDWATALSPYALLNSPPLVGTPTAPTQTPGDNSTKLATTAFVQSAVAGSVAGVASWNGRTGIVTLTFSDITGVFAAGSTTPAMDGTAAVGVANTWSRSDHVHPSDTSRLAAASNLSDLGNAGTARTNLGLGTIATQSAASVAVTGGAINSTPIGGTTPSTGAFTALTTNTPALISGFGVPINLALSASIASNALTISILGANGSAPSASNPVHVPTRDATLTAGDPLWTTITGANSLTIPSGATLGTGSGSPFRLWLVGFRSAGAIVLGALTCIGGSNPGIYPLAGNALGTVSAAAISSGSTSAQTPYAASAVTSCPYAILGYLEYGSGLTTAGTWNALPTKIQLFGPAVPLPGHPVGNTLYVNNGGGSTTTSTTQVAVAGTLVLTPMSPIAAIRYVANWNAQENSGGAGVNTTYTGSFRRNGSIIGGSYPMQVISSAGANVTVSGNLGCCGLDFPFSSSSQTYQLYHSTSSSAAQATTQGISIVLEELMC